MSLANVIIEQIGQDKWVGHIESGLGSQFRRDHFARPSLPEVLQEVMRIYNERMGVALNKAYPEIENEAITPEMVEAGIEEISDYPDFAYAETAVRAIFTAMDSARREQRSATRGEADTHAFIKEELAAMERLAALKLERRRGRDELDNQAAIKRTRKPRKPMSEEHRAAAVERGRQLAAKRWGKRDQPAEPDSPTVD